MLQWLRKKIRQWDTLAVLKWIERCQIAPGGAQRIGNLREGTDYVILHTEDLEVLLKQAGAELSNGAPYVWSPPPPRTRPADRPSDRSSP